MPDTKKFNTARKQIPDTKKRHIQNLSGIQIIFLLSAFLRNCFLCWDHWNGDVMPILDAALLCSSRADTDLGHESGLVWRSFMVKLKFTDQHKPFRETIWSRDYTKFEQFKALAD